jgi:hypothetical protein
MVDHAWSPRLLGLEKRIMLEHIVIPTMATERLNLATQVRWRLGGWWGCMGVGAGGWGGWSHM